MPSTVPGTRRSGTAAATVGAAAPAPSKVHARTRFGPRASRRPQPIPGHTGNPPHAGARVSPASRRPAHDLPNRPIPDPGCAECAGHASSTNAFTPAASAASRLRGHARQQRSRAYSDGRSARARRALRRRSAHGVALGKVPRYFQCFLSQRFGPLSVHPNARSVGAQKIRTCM
jgi:hypothetical protein